MFTWLLWRFTKTSTLPTLDQNLSGEGGGGVESDVQLILSMQSYTTGVSLFQCRRSSLPPFIPEVL